jgi:transcriptional regulator with XRE-family HTH domain
MYAPTKATIALMHKTIDKILAELMSKAGLNQADLSRMANVGQPTISRILKPNGPKGIKEPSDKQVRPLADFFGVSTDQLRGYAPLSTDPQESVAPKEKPASSIDAVKEMLARATKIPEHLKKKILEAAEQPAIATNVIAVDFSRPGQVGDEVWIAHYDVRAAMGGGQIPHEYPEMLQDIRVSPRHLREMGVQFKEHFHLKMITGWGQSMAPTIKDRDPLLVDVTVREFTGDGIYLLSHDEMLYVKRLQKKGKDHFKMISDNKLHDPQDIRVDDTHILARVLYVWNGQAV